MSKETRRCEWCGDIAQGACGCPAEVEIERLRSEVERLQPMEMALCERHSLVLRVGVPYVFRPVGDCHGCAEMAAKAREAYGP